MKYESHIAFRSLRYVLPLIFVSGGIMQGFEEGMWFTLPVHILLSWAIFHFLGKVYNRVEIEGDQLVFKSPRKQIRVPIEEVESVTQGSDPFPRNIGLSIVSKTMRVVMFPELSTKRLHPLTEALQKQNPDLQVTVNTVT